MYGWHIVKNSRHLGFDSTKVIVEPGYIYSYELKPRPTTCVCGMHASEKLTDAISCAGTIGICHNSLAPIWICRIKLHGDIHKESNKFCGRHREVVWMISSNDFRDEYIYYRKQQKQETFMYADSLFPWDRTVSEVDMVANAARKKMMNSTSVEGKWARG